MLSLAKAAKDYYLQKLGEISPREDYYLRGGTATGHWRGNGAGDMGLEGTVTAEGLVRLFDGQHPATGQQLGKQLRTGGVAAWDLTFSADKSVSLLWALSDPDTQRHVLEGFNTATQAAFDYLESVASYTRGATRTPILDGHGQPVLDDNGEPMLRVETWPIPTNGYVAAWFTEFTSRADDPQLHTHAVVANKVQGVDGKWRTLDGRLLYRHRLAAGYIHEAVLRHELTRRLGVRWQPIDKGMADIDGFTRDQIEAFSRRHQQIETWTEQTGLPTTPAAHRVAAVATRNAKQDHPLADLRKVWLERAAEVGLTPQHLAQVTGRERSMIVPDTTQLFATMTSEHGLTEHAATFGQPEITQAIASAFSQGAAADTIRTLAADFVRARDIVPILPAGTDLSPPKLPPVEHIREPDDEPAVLIENARPPMHRRNGTPFPAPAHDRRYTTAQHLAIEQELITAAQEGLGAGCFKPHPIAIAATLARHPELTRAQRSLVSSLATSGNAIDVVVGAAGTGKTAVMAVLKELADTTDTHIIGAALAGRAAAELETDSAIPSFTIHRLLTETSPGELPKGTVLVVDEAGMVGTRYLAQLHHLTQASQGKLVLVGDHHQLPEIHAGGLFAALAERLPALELTNNLRQTAEWERTALAELRNGSVSRALAMYLKRSRIIIEPTRQATLERAVDDWHHYVTTTGDIQGALLIGHDNTTVATLNRLARERTEHPAGSRLEVGGRDFRIGDRVLCLQNWASLGVLNGDLGEIVHMGANSNRVWIKLDRNGERRGLPHPYLDAGHLDYGYAVTGHKAQGATVNKAFTVGSAGTHREWSYVTMSRGRRSNTLYLTSLERKTLCDHLDHEASEPHARLIADLGRSKISTAALARLEPAAPTWPR